MPQEGPSAIDRMLRELGVESKNAPRWMKRALDPDSPWITQADGSGASIKSMSSGVDGREIFFPTIRRHDEVIGEYPKEFERIAEDGTVFVEFPIREARGQALDQGDFLEFDSIPEANDFGDRLSKMADHKRHLKWDLPERELELGDPRQVEDAQQDALLQRQISNLLK